MDMKRAIIWVSDELAVLCKALASVCFLMMLAFVAIQIVARYLLQEPPTWTEELARFAMVWGGLLGATISFKEHHDPVLIQDKREPSSIMGIVVALARGGAVLAFLGPVLYFSIFGPNMNMARGFLARSAQRTADTLGFPMSYVAAAVPIMAAVILIHLAARACVDRNKHSEGQS